MRAVSIARLLMAALVLSGAQAADAIVWPTYWRIHEPGDAGLTCTQVHAVMAHVTSDIVMLNKARDRTGDMVRNQFAFDSSHGTNDYNHFRLGTAGDGEETFLHARQQIGISRGIAVRRLDYLNGLQKTCKDAAP